MIGGRWQSRFVQLELGHTLTLKHNPQETRCRLYEVVQATKGQAATDLTIKTKDGRNLILKAKNQTEREEWLAAILAAKNAPQIQADRSVAPELTGEPGRQEATPGSQTNQNLQNMSPHSTIDTPAEDLFGKGGDGPRQRLQPPIEPETSLKSINASKGEAEFATRSYHSGVFTGEFRASDRHGLGRFIYSNGNSYIGAWEADKKCGFGRLRWTNSDVYTGEWQDNKMWGYGKFEYANGNSYIGFFLADNKHGIGKFAWSNGDTYEGAWYQDEMHGSGTTTYTNGNVYVGTCKGNVKHGEGKMSWSSGDRYEGEWREGLIQGKGTFTYSDGGQYQGEWLQDRRHGHGTMKHANGDVYTGQWRGDMRDGSGTCQYANSDTFVGNFAENYREGWGVYSAAPVRMLNPQGEVRELKGDQYSGNWHKDKKHGYGKYVWSDGDVYEGNWENDLRAGDGTCIYANGDKYTGQWKEDMRHGWGRLVWADGNTYEGGWRNDNISPGTKGLTPSSSRMTSRMASTTPSASASVQGSPRVGASVHPPVLGLQDNDSAMISRNGTPPNDLGLQISDFAAEVASVATAPGTWLENLGGQQGRDRRGATDSTVNRTPHITSDINLPDKKNLLLF